MKDTALIDAVITKVKFLLPDIVKQGTSGIEKRLKSLEKRMKLVEESSTTITLRQASNFETLYEEITRCENQTEKPMKDLSSIRGSISSLQKEINKLKKTHINRRDSSSQVDFAHPVQVPAPVPAAPTLATPNPDLLALQEDIKKMKSSLFKIHDIEHFQDFVSNQYEDLSRSCSNNTKLLSDVESSLRAELQSGFATLEKEYLGEEGKLTSIRKHVINDIQDVTKDIETLKKNQQQLNTSSCKQFQLDDVKLTLERYEQYIRRNSLIIAGVIQTPGESTNDIAIDIFRSLNINISPSDIDRSHRLRSRTRNRHRRNFPEPIIVKLVSHDVKQAIYDKRHTLRKLPNFGGIFINENLTAYRRELYREVRTLHKLGWSSWTQDGVIWVCEGQRDHNSKIHRITTYADYYKVIESIGKR